MLDYVKLAGLLLLEAAAVGLFCVMTYAYIVFLASA